MVRAPWNIDTIKSNNSFLGTSYINTCTAFNINSSKTLMGHLMTSKNNFETINNIKARLEDFISQHKVKSAMIIGSKSPTTPVADISFLKNTAVGEIAKETFDKNSSKLFNLIHNILVPLRPSVFKGHRTPSANSSYVHDTENDITYICTYINNLKNEFVKDKNTLNKAFDYIKISPKDKLDFSI